MVVGLTIFFARAIIYEVLDSPGTTEITNRSPPLQNLAMADTMSGPLDRDIKGGKCSKTSILFEGLFLFNRFVILAFLFNTYTSVVQRQCFFSFRITYHFRTLEFWVLVFHDLGNKKKDTFSTFILSLFLLCSHLEMGILIDKEIWISAHKIGHSFGSLTVMKICMRWFIETLEHENMHAMVY